MNIIELIMSRLDDRFFDDAAHETGLSAEQTRTTTRAAIPALLTGLVSAIRRPTGTGSLGTSSGDGNLFGGLSSTLSSTLTGSGARVSSADGLGAVTTMLGEGRLASIVNAISGHSGANASQSRSLLGMLFPAVMGILGREQRSGAGGSGASGAMSLDGIARFLQGRRHEIAEALPAGVASSLRADGMLDDLEDEPGHDSAAAYRAGASRDTTARTGSARGTAGAPRTTVPRHTATPLRAEKDRNWFWPVAAGLAALALVVWGVTQLGDDEPDRTVTADTQAPAAEPAVEPADEPVQIAALPASERDLRVGNVDLGESLNDTVNQATATLSGISDEASAEAATPQLIALNEDLDALIPMADQLPESARSTFGSLAQDSYARVETEIDRIESLQAVPAATKDAARDLGSKLQSMFAPGRG